MSSIVDSSTLAYYDSKVKLREDNKIKDLPVSGSMDYVKWYFRTHRDGKVYGVKFAYTASDVIVPAGTKYGANTDLVAEASTRTISGRNDYDDINVFKHFDANVHLDENGNTIIDAIYGDDNFSYTGKVDVVCVFAPVYERVYVGYESTTKYLYIEWCDSPKEGFTLNKLCKDANGNNKGFYCITKFQAAKIDGVPYASAGLYPWSGESTGPCYNTCVDTYHAKHAYSCAMTVAELAMIQRIFLMKYGHTNYQEKLGGLTLYKLEGIAITFATTNKNYIVISTTNANNLYTYTRIDIGTRSSSTRTSESYNIICNAEILSKNDDIVVFNDLTTTGFTITDSNYSLVSIPDDVLCVKLPTTGEAKTVEDENIKATFNNGTDDIEVDLILDVNGTDYTLYAYDENDNEIGYSNIGDITNSIIYIDSNISVIANSNYVSTSIYKSGYSLDICGSDGCWEIGNFVNNQKYPSVISGVEVQTGFTEIIGNAVFEYDENTNPHVLIHNNPSTLTKTEATIDATYIDIGYLSHSLSAASYTYARDIHYDLNNGGFVTDHGGASSTTGLCDSAYILGKQKSGKYEFLTIGNFNGDVNRGIFYLSVDGILSHSSFTIASRPSLNGVMG